LRKKVINMLSSLRYDLKIIYNLIPEGSKVLDIGCGNGELLDCLTKRKKLKAIGIEINELKVAKCISKGLNVIQSDVTEGLQDYPDNSFDQVILSIILQEIENPVSVLTEMMRIGKSVIVSIKNIANWKNRINFLLNGNLALTEGTSEKFTRQGLFLSNIRNFKRFCKENKFKIIKQTYISNNFGTYFTVFNSFFAEIAIFVLKKGR